MPIGFLDRATVPMPGGFMIKGFKLGDVFRATVPRTILRVTMMTLAACAPVKTTTSKSSVSAAQEASPTAPSTISGDTKLTLPQWCRMTQSTEQLCFSCEREDSGTTIPYEQCLTPADSFQAERDCAYTDSVTKSITCAGTKSTESFVMDVSLAKEKVTAALPAVLFAIKFTIQQKFPDRPDIKAVSDELSDFFGSRIPLINRGEDLDRISGDLLLLVNKHLKTPLTEAQAAIFKKSAQDAFGLVAKDLSGTKDYSLSRVILRGLSIANTIPPEILGDAKPFLTGPGLADLLSQDQSAALIQTLRILNPSALGIKSPEDLISDLRKAP